MVTNPIVLDLVGRVTESEGHMRNVALQLFFMSIVEHENMLKMMF